MFFNRGGGKFKICILTTKNEVRLSVLLRVSLPSLQMSSMSENMSLVIDFNVGNPTEESSSTHSILY